MSGFNIKYDGDISVTVSEEEAREAFDDWKEAMGYPEYDLPGDGEDTFEDHMKDAAEWAARDKVSKAIKVADVFDVRIEASACRGVRELDDNNED